MTQLVYKNVQITVTEVGAFRATFGGKVVVKPSMAAMKKAIDGAGDAVFTAFDAINLSNDWSAYIRTVKITGTRKGLGRSKRTVWADQNGGAVDRGIMLDTPENRALLKAYMDKRNELDAQITKMREEYEALWDALPRIEPEQPAEKVKP